MATPTKESKKKAKKEKHEQKEKKERKSKEQRRSEVVDEDGDNNSMSRQSSKRRKLSSGSTTTIDAEASTKNPAQIGGADPRKEEIPAGDSTAAAAVERSSLAGIEKEDDTKPRSRDAIRRAKREHKKLLMAQLPTRDENGIAYTKLQLRRMRKRLERGLHPIETPREAADRARREAEMRKQEQAEWEGLLYQGKNDRNEGDDGSDDDNDEDNDDGDDDGIVGGDDQSDVDASGATNAGPVAATPYVPKRTPKKKRTKPIPPDYVCQACQNRHQPPHWIYDCVEKVTMRGTNQVSHKHGKGAQNPKNKVFVSGLPFDATSKMVTQWFADKCGAVLHVKLLTFDDSNRCKGQAFVAFESPDSVRAALALTGTVMTTDGKAKKGVEGSSSMNGKELKLKVTKALNRAVTKTKPSGEKSES